MQYPYYNSMQQPMQNGILWVQGIEGAKAYPMAPNSNLLLMDSETNGRFYIKSCDNVGMCSLRYFDYTEVNKSEVDTSKFVTRDELANIISDLKGSLTNEQPVSTVAAKQRTSNSAKN